VDRKYRDPWTGKIPARFMIASNELPRFGDASGAISNRFVMLTMTQSFLGREDPALTGKLLVELPGILRWSLDGLDRLATTGHFTSPAASQAMVAAMHDLVSPMGAFVRDRCNVGPGLEVSVAEMFAAWNLWCFDNGRDHPGTVQTFGRDLMTVAPGVHVKQVTRGDTRIRLHVGMSLRPQTDNRESRVQPRAGVWPDARAARSNTRENALWPVQKLCIMHACQQQAVQGTQFCASHPNGEPAHA
jgi:putative DNA primase/helicase